MCKDCNDFLNDYNDFFSLDPFCMEHHKVKYCENKMVDLNDDPLSCIMIYSTNLKKFSYPYSSNQPERSKRENTEK